MHFSHRRLSTLSLETAGLFATFARIVVASGILCAPAMASADVGWIPMRDQNPFVLGVGIPLPPQPEPMPGAWGVDAYVAEGNTQLISRSSRESLIFAAETRESRVAVNYAFNSAWSARVSFGDEWIGVGFLDGPIQRFHKLIGAPRGYRGGRLGVKPPFIEVTEDGRVTYRLDKTGQAVAPLLVDLERVWELSGDSKAGLMASAKFATGSSAKLSDTGSYSESIAAFWDAKPREYLQFGARLGYLHQSAGDVLSASVRSSAVFGDAYARVPLFGRWYGQLQYDVHSPLYRHGPSFLRYSGSLNTAVVRQFGSSSELIFGIGEDVPIAHTQDAVLQVALRVH